MSKLTPTPISNAFFGTIETPSVLFRSFHLPKVETDPLIHAVGDPTEGEQAERVLARLLHPRHLDRDAGNIFRYCLINHGFLGGGRGEESTVAFSPSGKEASHCFWQTAVELSGISSKVNNFATRNQGGSLSPSGELNRSRMNAPCNFTLSVRRKSGLRFS